LLLLLLRPHLLLVSTLLLFLLRALLLVGTLLLTRCIARLRGSLRGHRDRGACEHDNEGVLG